MASDRDEDDAESKRQAKNPEVYNSAGWSEDHLRQLSALQVSEFGKALELLFIKLQRADAEILFDEKMGFPDTQFARGRLSMLREIDLFLREDAKALYEMRVAAGQRKPGVAP